ncbi:hypothetical protein [Streptomyces sp. NPDC088246]|uniref:hypothetical protein n=1 Tax=Streptomyces sp. NPDC088246 TaxID=3365842 RepID=UPI00381973AF
MTTTALYEIETSEGDDGSAHPVECIWTPGEDARASLGLRHLIASPVGARGLGGEADARA